MNNDGAPRGKRAWAGAKDVVRKRKTITVRLMAPFSMTCENCHDFIYRGTKFNAKKEPTGDKYFDIQLIKFSIRCPQCANIIVFRTDPQSANYVLLSGAQRLHAPAASNESKTEAERLDQLENEAKQRGDFSGLSKTSLDKLEDVAATHSAELAREKDLAEIQKRAREIDSKQANLDSTVRNPKPDEKQKNDPVLKPTFKKLTLPPLRFRAHLCKT